MKLISTLGKASDLWKQLELAFELKSVLQETVDWGQEEFCWFQRWENSTGFFWPV